MLFLFFTSFPSINAENVFRREFFSLFDFKRISEDIYGEIMELEGESIFIFSMEFRLMEIQ